MVVLGFGVCRLLASHDGCEQQERKRPFERPPWPKDGHRACSRTPQLPPGGPFTPNSPDSLLRMIGGRAWDIVQPMNSESATGLVFALNVLWFGIAFLS